MVLIPKVLKRRDGASIVVAIVLGTILAQLISSFTASIAGPLSGLQEGQFFSAGPPGTGVKGMYLQPLVWALLQIIALELLLWLYVYTIAPIFKEKSDVRSSKSEADRRPKSRSIQ